MNVRLQVLKYLIADWISASAAWTFLFIFRKTIPEPDKFGYAIDIHFDANYYYGLFFIPFFWVMLYIVAGQYTRIYRKHRLKELSQTLVLSILGVMAIFFVFLLDDQIASYKNYYQSLLALFFSHFGFTILLRLILTTRTVHRVHRGDIGFNTIMVGGNEMAINIYDEIKALPKSPGFKFLGFVRVNGVDNQLTQQMPLLGTYKDLPQLIAQKNVQEVIIAIESSDHGYLENILNQLEGTGVNIKVIPDMYDILTGSVKMTSIFGAPLIQINREIMPAWQFSVKRIVDVSVSIFALLILSPVYLMIALLVRLSSPGKIFFIQERIGKYGQPFNIYKFRTMVKDAESEGPQLSSSNDARITPLGRSLRKTRLDELPQFLNVVLGDMALVGPRPERQHFIDRITERAPHYRHLHKVRPGITSWGQVKYGYAENVDQMIQRLKYDILYIENMSIAVDLKILIYTVMIVLKGSGK
ncbi:MAG: exopolysaccharide biosynthesis polyprenyl glycosylphosphotransferase [Flavobacteriales bacterium]|jgi:exopolysaccharide biosynthesis polyprenyl glycosylphosphotransferase